MSEKNNQVKWINFKSAGVTLVEVMIAVAILGAISVGVINLTQQTSQSTAKIEMTSDVTLTTNEINALLSDPIKCRLTFENSNKPDAIVGSYDDTVSPPVKKDMRYEVFNSSNNAYYGSANLKILSYELIKNPSNTEDGTLEITIQNKTIINKDEPIIKRVLSMYVEWNATDPNKVEECRTLAGSTSTIWTRGSGTNIYYIGGYVGIGTDDPKYTLDVKGNVYVDKITANTFLYKSDENLKENIEQIHNPLEKVLSLRGVKFDWRTTNENDYGFIAQEIQNKIPEIVHQDKAAGILTVDYAKVIPFLVEAIKVQQNEIKNLEKKISEMERQ